MTEEAQRLQAAAEAPDAVLTALGDADMCRELPFHPVAGIRGALPISGAAGAYRGIRAITEQRRRA